MQVQQSSYVYESSPPGGHDDGDGGATSDAEQKLMQSKVSIKDMARIKAAARERLDGIFFDCSLMKTLQRISLWMAARQRVRNIKQVANQSE